MDEHREGMVRVSRLCAIASLLFVLSSCAGMRTRAVDCAEYGISFEVPAGYRLEEDRLLPVGEKGAEFADLIEHYFYRFAGSEYVTVSRLADYGGSMLAASEAAYVESEDGSFRGMRYFAELAQDEYPCVSCVLVLTDKKVVFEFVSRRYLSERYKGRIRKGAIRDFDQGEYSAYLRSIFDNKKEEVVRKYEGEFQAILESLRASR